MNGPASDSGTWQAYRLFAISMFLVIVVGFVIQSIAPRTGLAITELLLILLPAVLFVRSKGLAVREGLRISPVTRLDVLLSIAVGISGWGVALGIHQLVVLGLGSPPTANGGIQSVGEWLMMLVVGALLPGICEESLFRGAIQGVLERRGATRAVVITALLFGIFHLDPWRLLSAIFLGLIYGTLVVRTNSIIPAILAHTSNNATAITVAYLLQNESSIVSTLPWILIPTFVLCAGFYWQLSRGRAAVPSPLAEVPAAHSWRRPSLLKMFLIVAAMFLGLIVAGIVSTVDIQTIESTDLGPQFRRGDHVLVVLDRQGNLPIRSGYVVSYRREKSESATLGRVVRSEAERVWIAVPAGELEVARSDILGILVYPAPSR